MAEDSSNSVDELSDQIRNLSPKERRDLFEAIQKEQLEEIAKARKTYLDQLQEQGLLNLESNQIDAIVGMPNPEDPEPWEPRPLGWPPQAPWPPWGPWAGLGEPRPQRSIPSIESVGITPIPIPGVGQVGLTPIPIPGVGRVGLTPIPIPGVGTAWLMS
jgi:hypothetical protein